MTDIRGDFFGYAFHLAALYVLEDNANYSSIDGILYNKDKTTLVCYPISKSGFFFTIPNTVKTIGYGAFYECENLISIDMSSVEILEDISVYNCVNLSMVTIPNTVTSIGKSSFSKCNLLRNVIVSWQDPSIVTYGERLFASSATTIFKKATLHVPAGTTAAYQAVDPWSSFVTIQEDNTYHEVTSTTEAFEYAQEIRLADFPLSLTGKYDIRETGTSTWYLKIFKLYLTPDDRLAYYHQAEGLEIYSPQNTITKPTVTNEWLEYPSERMINRGENVEGYYYFVLLSETQNDSYEILFRDNSTLPILAGSVSISGNAVFGETLTAVTDALTSTPVADLGVFTYQWKRGETVIGTNSETYTLVADDVDNVISVTVTAANCSGEKSTETAVAVSKASQNSVPAVLTVASKTYNSLTLAAIEGAEYCVNGGDWQKSTLFENLEPNTTYEFEARYAETATHNASQKSDKLLIQTDIDPNTGIDEVALLFKVYSQNGTIIVENSTALVTVYNSVGRLVGIANADTIVEIPVPQSGVYVVQSGSAVKKVVVR